MAIVWKFGNHVDTDQIVPGRFAPYMRPNEDVGTAAFIEAHPEFNANAKPGDIIVAGENFGCGSSREYAPLALKRREIGAIVAKSFARIFFRNAINLGIPIYISPEIAGQIEDQAEVEFNLAESWLKAGGSQFELPELPTFAQSIIAAGGVTSYVREHGRLPTV